MCALYHGTPNDGRRELDRLPEDVQDEIAASGQALSKGDGRAPRRLPLQLAESDLYADFSGLDVDLEGRVPTYAEPTS